MRTRESSCGMVTCYLAPLGSEVAEEGVHPADTARYRQRPNLRARRGADVGSRPGRIQCSR